MICKLKPIRFYNIYDSREQIQKVKVVKIEITVSKTQLKQLYVSTFKLSQMG